VRSIFSVRARRVRNRRNKPARIGFVLYESRDIVVIATTRKSKNTKTGNMVQVWILHRNISPIDAVKQGKDAVICFDCKHRGNGFAKRTCYVNLRSPQAIWKAYRRGRYPFLATASYSAVFSDRKIRFGAYGEPVRIPLPIVDALTRVAKGWTGYTHQWRRAEFQAYRAYVMASVDSESEAQEAVRMGWRYFRVREHGARLLPGEINCPASDECGHKTTCERCGLCNGVRFTADPRKSITIQVHGSGRKNFVSLDAIARAA